MLSSLCPGACQAEEREQSTGSYHCVNLVIDRLLWCDFDKGSLSHYMAVNLWTWAMRAAELRHSSPRSHGHHGPEGTVPGGIGGNALPTAACQWHRSDTTEA